MQRQEIMKSDYQALILEQKDQVLNIKTLDQPLVRSSFAVNLISLFSIRSKIRSVKN